MGVVCVLTQLALFFGKVRKNRKLPRHVPVRISTIFRRIQNQDARLKILALEFFSFRQVSKKFQEIKFFQTSITFLFDFDESSGWHRSKRLEEAHLLECRLSLLFTS